jgi:hypothetical protein
MNHAAVHLMFSWEGDKMTSSIEEVLGQSSEISLFPLSLIDKLKWVAPSKDGAKLIEIPQTLSAVPWYGLHVIDVINDMLDQSTPIQLMYSHPITEYILGSLPPCQVVPEVCDIEQLKQCMIKCIEDTQNQHNYGMIYYCIYHPMPCDIDEVHKEVIPVLTKYFNTNEFKILVAYDPSKLSCKIGFVMTFPLENCIARMPERHDIYRFRRYEKYDGEPDKVYYLVYYRHKAPQLIATPKNNTTSFDRLLLYICRMNRKNNTTSQEH